MNISKWETWTNGHDYKVKEENGIKVLVPAENKPYPVVDENGTPIGTAKMTDAEFTAIRDGNVPGAIKGPDISSVVIGGSAAAIVMGVSPWTSRTEYANEKSGLFEPKVKHEFNSAAKEAGHVYEDAVAESFVKYMKRELKADVEIMNDDSIYRNTAYPFAQVNLDRRIVAINGKPCDGILECKTTSFRNVQALDKWKAGICPEYYELQCRYYMAVMDVDFCYICCSWGFTAQEMAVVRIDRDKSIEKVLMEECQYFSDSIEQGIEVAETNQNTQLLVNFYQRLYGAPKKNKEPIELPESCINSVCAAIDLEEKIKEQEEVLDHLKSKKSEILANLYPLFKISDSDVAEYGSVRIDDNRVAGVKLDIPMKRAKFDEERFKIEHPDMYDKYSKMVFQATEFGKKEKKLKAEYTLPAEVNAEKQPDYSIIIREIPA